MENYKHDIYKTILEKLNSINDCMIKYTELTKDERLENLENSYKSVEVLKACIKLLNEIENAELTKDER